MNLRINAKTYSAACAALRGQIEKLTLMEKQNHHPHHAHLIEHYQDAYADLRVAIGRPDVFDQSELDLKNESAHQV